ncbi:MAG TPA: response regulator [Haliangiales bacterium]|nr:response regulator [Haliangiales bacterium]
METSPLLLVEDDDDIRDIVSEALRGAGHEVRAAATGGEGLAEARRSPRPRVIFLDITLPDMDGWQFLDEKKRDPDIAAIPVVVVTASGRGGRERAGADVVAWLCKPVDLDDLLAAAGIASSHAGGSARRDDIDAEHARQYLVRRNGDLAAMEHAVAAAAHDNLRRWGHNLRGTAAAYGHPALGHIGARLEVAALAEDPAAEREAVAEIAAYLRRHLP